jgi:hypothetical protein
LPYISVLIACRAVLFFSFFIKNECEIKEANFIQLSLLNKC